MIEILIILIAAIIMETIDSGLGMMYGTLLSPILIIAGYEAMLVVPAILLSQAIGGFCATYTHHKFRNAIWDFKSDNLKITAVILSLGLIAVVIGVYIGTIIPSNLLKTYIGILCVIMGGIVVFGRKFKFSWRKIAGLGLISSFNKALCYDKDTEILTKDNGWILFKDLRKDDYVATLDSNHIFNWEKPIALQSYKYKGKLIHIKHKTIDMLVTPNHKVYVREQNSKDYELIEAKDLKKYAYRTVNKVNWNSNDIEWFHLPKIEYDNRCHKQYKEVDKIKMDNWLDFLGWYISEGFILHTNSDKSYRVCITQVKNKYKDDIETCLNNLGYNWFRNKKDYIIYNKQLWTYLTKLGKSKDKYIPQEFMNLSKRQLSILLSSLVKGDGTVDKYGVIHIYSISEKLINQLQEIIIKLGYNGNVHKRNRLGESHYKKDGNIIEHKNISYEINFRYSRECFIKTKQHIIEEFYDDIVYCCTVPNHIMLVRRNGKPSWSGNSGGGFGPVVATGNIASGIKEKRAIGITDFAEAPICLASFGVWVYFSGFPYSEFLLPLCIGAGIGGVIGPILLSKVKSKKYLKLAVGQLAIVSGVIILTKLYL